MNQLDSTAVSPIASASSAESDVQPRPSRFAAQLGLAIVVLTLVVCFGILASASRGHF